MFPIIAPREPHGPGTAARHDLPSGPTDNIDGEPPPAQNTPICIGTWSLDLDSQAARNGGYSRVSQEQE
jgi:hypothetical protein